MGHIHRNVRLRAEKVATARMLVDTGATFSVVPRRLAWALGIKRARPSVNVVLADGRRVRMGAGVAVVRIGDREAPTTILLGLAVDPKRGRLRPTRPYTVRLGGYR